MKEIIVDELPKTCGDCGFHDCVYDPDGPDIHYCKAFTWLNENDEMGNHTSEYDKTYNKIRDSRCPLKLKGYCSEEIITKMLDILLSEQTEKNRKNLNDVFRYFLNIKKES
ncbi:hypothetical protein J6W34_09315 [bacterium]|nr:hypothetical protein [bacterium]